MDGVLFLSTDAHARAYKETLAREGITEFDYTRFAGIRTDETLACIMKRHGRPPDAGVLQRLTAEKRAAARRFLREAPPIVPGCRSLVRSLGERFRLALASSSSRENVDLFLQKADLRDAFEVVLHGDDVRRAKPEPELYLKIAESLHLPPEQCLVVEDSESGVKAAVAAGMPVYGVVGTLSRDELESLGVQKALDSVAELEALE
jgi:HAD superfamily hydrolase (TIGR01509 family)